MTKEDVYTHLHKELAFLESLAFNGMESKSIILPPKLLRIASQESGCSLQHQSNLLNIGILKSLDYKPIGTCIEADKNHYFPHLSFQEHFAARYLIKALNSVPAEKKKAIECIEINKYNQRFELVFIFASGLLIECNDQQSINLFWDTLLREPLDLIGIRHQYILISCFEEAGCRKSIPKYCQSMNLIIKWIKYSLSTKHYASTDKHSYSQYHLLVALISSPSLVNQPEILDTLSKLYKDNDSLIKRRVLQFISDLQISNLYLLLIQLHLISLNDQKNEVRSEACVALGKMDEKAATNEVINRPLVLLDDTNVEVRRSARNVLGGMGENAATTEVINRFMILLGDSNDEIRVSACNVLGGMGEKVAANDVINKLAIPLGDLNVEVR